MGALGSTSERRTSWLAPVALALAVTAPEAASQKTGGAPSVSAIAQLRSASPSQVQLAPGTRLRQRDRAALGQRVGTRLGDSGGGGGADATDGAD